MQWQVKFLLIVTTAVTAVFYYYSLLAHHVQFAIKAYITVPCNEIFILACWCCAIFYTVHLHQIYGLIDMCNTLSLLVDTASQQLDPDCSSTHIYPLLSRILLSWNLNYCVNIFEFFKFFNFLCCHFSFLIIHWCREKEGDLTQSLIHCTNRKFKNQLTTQQNATRYFDYTTIVDRLRTISWSNNSHPSGVVKPFYRYPTFPLTAKAVQSKGHTFTLTFTELKDRVRSLPFSLHFHHLYPRTTPSKLLKLTFLFEIVVM